VVGETPKCFYIQWWMMKPKRILKNARNSWAKESRLKALESLIIRRKIYIETLERKIKASKIAIANAEAMIMEDEE
jgi:hypothetical protein